jgi:hypothetical protein
MLGFAILHGPMNRESSELSLSYAFDWYLIGKDIKHICSAERMPFSLAYFGSLGLTLFFAIGVSLQLSFLLPTSPYPNLLA